MEKAFDISSKVFIVTFCLMVASIFANIKPLEEIASSPFPYIRPMVSLLKAIDIPNYYLTMLSGLSSLVTYIGKRLVSPR